MHYARLTDFIAIAPRASMWGIPANPSKPFACFWSKFFDVLLDHPAAESPAALLLMDCFISRTHSWGTLLSNILQ